MKQNMETEQTMPLSRTHRGLVAFASIFVAFCNFGILNAYGTLFTATLEKFGEGRSITSLVHSLLVGTSLGVGVVGGYFITRFNHTVVAGIGSVLFPLGLVTSYFATSVTFLIVSVSIVAGVGISFTYVSAVIVLNSVIPEKHQTTALSVQNMACGAAGIVVPYLFDWLTKTYRLNGTFLIYGGIIMNNIAAVILFSGIKSVKSSDIKTEFNKEIHVSSHDTYKTDATSVEENDIDITEIYIQHNNQRKFSVQSGKRVQFQDDGKRVQFQDDISIYNKNTNENEHECHAFYNEVITDEMRRSSEGDSDIKPIKATRRLSTTNAIFRKASLLSTGPIVISHEKHSKRTTFIVFLIIQPLVLGNIAGIQTLYQDVGVFKGLSSSQVLVCIAAYNVSSTIGRFLPAVLQKLTENPLLTPIIACLSGAVGQTIIQMTSQYYSLLIGYSLTGMLDGGISSSTSVVIFKILRQETQAMGFGLVLTVSGILATACGPLYGAIYDESKSYTLVLSLTTGCLALGALMFVGCFILYRNNK